MKRPLQQKVSTQTVSLLIAFGVFLCTLFARRQGWLQFLEFQAYDFAIRHQTKATNTGPIVLIEMTEGDIHKLSLDYPLYDDKLAQLLNQISTYKPAVIGLDIWRDMPVPRNGNGIAALNQTLLTQTNIVCIFTTTGIQPPGILKSNYDRIAFNNNFPVDVDVDRTIPKVRRSLLFDPTPTGELLDALPFRLAERYLETRGIFPEADPVDPRAFRLGKARLAPFQSTDGAYVGADSLGWQLLLDFKCPETFTRFTVSDVLEEKIPVGALQDKVVIVGMNAPSVSDERVTPIRRDHRGIELQAMTVNQLIRHALDGDKPIQSWSDSMEVVWILLWTLAGGAIAFWIRSPWLFASIIVACLIGLTGIAWWSFNSGWWIPLVTPAMGFIPAAVLAVSYISSHERSMRAVLMKLYSRHVSKEIAESIWANRESFLEGQRPLAQKLVVTVLFTDLKGFSSVSEKMEPARLYEWLNGYLGAMAKVIQDHGGVLKQFTGDGVLALFGVPVPHTTLPEQQADASAAVRCALGMGQRLIELSKTWQAAGLPLVSMRAGIYTGEVAAGSVGSDDRFEYAVIGDVVNTASRLESYDKSLADPDLLPNRCRILIGAPTHDLLGGKFLSQEIGLLEVKGKINKVPVFQILGLNQEREATPTDAYRA